MLFLSLIVTAAARACGYLRFLGINIGIGADRAKPDKSRVKGKILVFGFRTENPKENYQAHKKGHIDGYSRYQVDGDHCLEDRSIFTVCQAAGFDLSRSINRCLWI